VYLLPLRAPGGSRQAFLGPAEVRGGARRRGARGGRVVALGGERDGGRGRRHRGVPGGGKRGVSAPAGFRARRTSGDVFSLRWSVLPRFALLRGVPLLRCARQLDGLRLLRLLTRLSRCPRASLLSCGTGCPSPTSVRCHRVSPCPVTAGCPWRAGELGVADISGGSAELLMEMVGDGRHPARRAERQDCRTRLFSPSTAARRPGVLAPSCNM
jgi:hypothetical protein